MATEYKLPYTGREVKERLDAVSNKVDKVSGKGLSTNDFTNEYKNKLDSLENIEVEETDPTVPAWAKKATKPTYTKSEVGLGNVENKSSATIRGELTKKNVTDALGYTPPTTNTTYSEATTTSAGLMSAADKVKLNNAATTTDIENYVNTAILNGEW